MDANSDNSEGCIAVISTNRYIYKFHTTIGLLLSLSMELVIKISDLSSTPIISLSYVLIRNFELFYNASR